MTDGKIGHSVITEQDAALTEESFIAFLREACHNFDSATPMVLQNHIKHFKKFNIVRFRASDYVESINYDSLNVEIVKEDEKKNSATAFRSR